MIKTLAYIIGFVFLVVGIMGFIPALTPNGLLLNLFEVDAMHNMVHILTGILGLVAGAVSATASVWFFRVFGVVYALVTLLGFIGQDPVLGMVVVNSADNMLHLVLSVLLLVIGFGLKTDTSLQNTISKNPLS